MALSPVLKLAGGVLAVAALAACYPTLPSSGAAVAQAQFVPLPIIFLQQADLPQTRSAVVDEGAEATPEKKFFPFPLPIPLPIFVPLPKPILNFLGYTNNQQPLGPVIVSQQRPPEPQVIIVPQPSQPPTPCCTPVQPPTPTPYPTPRPNPTPQPTPQPQPQPQPTPQPIPQPQPTPYPKPPKPHKPNKPQQEASAFSEPSKDTVEEVLPEVEDTQGAEEEHNHEHFHDDKELSEEDYQLVHHEGEDAAEHLKHARHHH